MYSHVGFITLLSQKKKKREKAIWGASPPNKYRFLVKARENLGQGCQRIGLTIRNQSQRQPYGLVGALHNHITRIFRTCQCIFVCVRVFELCVCVLLRVCITRAVETARKRYQFQFFAVEHSTRSHALIFS